MLTTVAAGYVVIAGLLYLYQDQLVYFPERALTATPAHAGLAYEPVRFTSADGVALSGWFIPACEGPAALGVLPPAALARPSAAVPDAALPPPSMESCAARGTLLFCHGNAGNISHRLESIRQFHQLGVNVFIFDYRGYGASEGVPTEAGTYRDAEAARRYLVETRDLAPEHIVYFGRSLGAAIAAWLATQHPPRALIVESAFTSVPDFGAEIYPWLPVRLLARLRYPTREYLQSVKVPVLVIHSRDDEIVSFRHAEKLYESANSPKELLEIHGGHNDGFLVSGAHYTRRLDGFLRRVGL
ncbi:MAG: alpha/beta hydrolase [Gammaproteobacteria bacterium]|nr:alpha/beta hydrolase [Gammaproteobacteria bacterium]